MNKLILLFVFGLSAQFVIAQESLMSLSTTPNMHNKDGDAEIVEMTHQLYKSMAQISQNQDGNIEHVTNFLDKDFIAVRIVTGIDGKQNRSQLSLDDYRKQLFLMAKFTGLNTSYQIDDVNFVRTYETVAVINYSLLVTATYNGEEVLRFRSIVTNYMRKEEKDGWKVLESNGLNVYREQEVGICPVAFSQTNKDGTQYTATVVSPAGNTLHTDVLTFAFKGSNGKTIITNGNNAWLLAGKELSCVKDNGKVVNTKLGMVNGQVESIQTILAQQLFRDKCLSFKTLEK